MELRPMTMEDADKMLEWKNYPETRMFALKSHAEIYREDHLKWLEKNIQYFQIIIHDNKVAGAIRLENNEISVWIDKAFRGIGLATQAIKAVSRVGTIARIVPANIPSIKAFIRCGFVPEQYVSKHDHILGDTSYYIFIKH